MGAKFESHDDDRHGTLSHERWRAGLEGLPRTGQGPVLHCTAHISACPQGALEQGSSASCHHAPLSPARPAESPKSHKTCNNKDSQSNPAALECSENTNSSQATSVYRDCFFTQFQLLFFHKKA